MAKVIRKGTLILRGQNWYSDFKFQGRRYKRALGPNWRDAQAEDARLRDQIRSGKAPAPVAGAGGGMTWEEFLAWAHKVSTGDKSERSVKRDRIALAHLERLSRASYLSQITPPVLKDYVRSRKAEGMSPATIARELGSLKSLLAQAAEDGYTTDYNWRKVRGPQVPTVVHHSHSPEELSRLIASCKGIWKTIAFVGGRAGLRREEIFYLTWKDVDFSNNLIHVTHKDGWVTKSQKERAVSLMPDLRGYLLSIRPSDNRRWVLGDKDDWRPQSESMTAYFTRLTHKAGLLGGIHTLRHTFGTMMANDGVNINTLMEWMGHSDIKMTMRYVGKASEYALQVAKVLPLPPPLPPQGMGYTGNSATA